RLLECAPPIHVIQDEGTPTHSRKGHSASWCGRTGYFNLTAIGKFGSRRPRGKVDLTRRTYVFSTKYGTGHTNRGGGKGEATHLSATECAAERTRSSWK